MGRGKFKGKPTGHRNFSTHEELLAGTSARPRTFRREEVEEKEAEFEEKKEEEDSDEEADKRKGTQGLIEIENPNLVKSKNLKAKNVDIDKTTELSRRERLKNWVAHLIKRSQALVVLISDFRVLAREVIEKQKAHERYMRLQEQGKTDQARKDLERLALIRKQRAEAAKKRDEERAAREQKKVEVRK